MPSNPTKIIFNNFSMPYVSRRIAVINENGEEVEFSDREFFNLDKPLVILGEPGLGKSALVEEFAKQTNSKKYIASEIPLHSSLESKSHPAKVIIDGLDEIIAYSSSGLMDSVWGKLAYLTKPNFVLTCRAVDWAGPAITTVISTRWHEKPIIGRLLPLNQEEMDAFVTIYGNGQSADQFIEEARKRDLIDLLRNPQQLMMLLDIIQDHGWPESRLALFENSCHVLISENSQVHDAINRDRPSNDTLLNAAGFICAQLLLSGNSRIRIDSSSNPDLPRGVELIGCDFDQEVIAQALSTKVFRLGFLNVIEPTHRTIAEYLAAKWLSSALLEKLPLRRLETLLYGNKKIVPSALRGIHAWLATLASKLTIKLIERDPYGFFRYGGPSVLTTEQSRFLLKSLEDIAETDPYFRSEDWHATFGQGLIKKELLPDIVRLIRNPSTPYQLSALIIESIQGDDLTNEISDDLIAISKDSSTTPLERHAAIEALFECKAQPNWNNFIDDLIKMGGIEELRLSLKIVQQKIDCFTGQLIASILIKMAEGATSDDEPSYSGLGYGLNKKMSSAQLEESLTFLSEYQLNNEANMGLNDPAKWIFEFAQEYLERGDKPTASTLWNWISGLNRHSYYRSGWDKFSVQFFSENKDYRRAVQTEALKKSLNADQLWTNLCGIGNLAAGLWVHEEDVICHLDLLIAEKDQYDDWPIRWRHYVHWARIHSDFCGSALEHARKQAEDFEELKKQLADLERPPERDYDREFQEELNQRDLQRAEETAIRHEHFKSKEDDLREGISLEDMYKVAGAYLGEFRDINADTPMGRVAELVGERLASTALEGIPLIIERSNIPSARGIIELHAKESKRYHFETILLAHCAVLISKGKSLHDLSFDITSSALAACHWDVHLVSHDLTSLVQEQLETNIFANKEIKETFIRDTMEPYFEKEVDNVSGLYRLARKEEFADISGLLSLEWLNKYPKLSKGSLAELMGAAIRFGKSEDLISLIRERIRTKGWPNEEQQAIWMQGAFLVDFDHHLNTLNLYADEKKERLWAFKDLGFHVVGFEKNKSPLSPAQNYFLINHFGPHWPRVESPTSGWWGDQNPWDASQIIAGRISALSVDLSDEAGDLLESLINKESLKDYQNQIRHVYAQQTRQRTEKNKTIPTLTGVRNVLLQGDPSNIDDLQAVIMDELVELQERIRNSPTNEILPFWEGDSPHDENYCRDRIAASLTPYLGRFNIRVHTEGAMPDSKRCDLLNTHDELDLPIEIKRQWHNDIWKAASNQLQAYTKEYWAKGRGVYLVLWFGYIESGHSKNPRGWQGQGMPKAFEEMKKLLSKKYEGLSEKTKIFVLDLSKGDD